MAERLTLKYETKDAKLNMVLRDIIRKINDKVEWILAPTFSKMKLKDTDETHLLSLKWNEDETVKDRTLNFKVNAGDRTIDMSANLTVEGATTTDQDYTSDATVRFAKLGLGMAATNVLDVTGDSGLNGAVTINDANADKDFRVEGSGATYTHLLFTDASANKVGINEDAPKALFHIRGATCADYTGVGSDTFLIIENDDNVAIQLQAATTGTAYIEFADDNYNPPAGRVAYDFANEQMEFSAATNETFYIKDGYVTTADGMELAVGNFGAPTNPLHVKDQGTVSGWGGAYGGVVARFTADENKHTSVCIDALTGYDPVLGLSENGSAMWDIRNDASTTDTLNIRYQVGAANAIRLAINNAGHFDFQAGNLVTTGTLGAGVATLATNSTIGNLTLADGSITDSGGAISFGDENLSTTGTLGSGVFTITANSDTMVFTPDGTNANIQWSDGVLNLITDEGTNTNTHVYIKGKGTGEGQLRIYEEDDADYVQIKCIGAYGYIGTGGTTPGQLLFQQGVDQNVAFFPWTTTGNNYIYWFGQSGGVTKKGWLKVNSAGNVECGADSGQVFFYKVGTTDVMLLAETYVEIKDDIILTFGDDSDYGIGFNSANDVLRLVDGSDLTANIRLEMDSSGHFDFKAGNMVTTGTLDCGAITGTSINAVCNNNEVICHNNNVVFN